ncbi:hypothetical protein GMA11_05110 [Granulicatella sp. zg-ZJ]|uniref:CdiA C-terminal domain-containing protein n=1 Tax=Granulicatella sp. zg-ZJ TaxID=2678504 RepID=UPI0013D6DFA5|nr:hypothetical protein [Granulicatella sp. zg-ZJ]NEW62766.1 hypothetical protein [Granulicatella sp. zg-ZJ]
MNYWEHEGVKYFVDGKHVVLDYSQKEKEVAEWFSKLFGTSVYLVPRINYPDSVHTPDYLIKDMKFDLKVITGAGKGTIDQNTRKARIQAENIIYDITDSSLSIREVIDQLNNIYKSGRRGLDIAVIKRCNKLIDILQKKN